MPDVLEYVHLDVDRTSSGYAMTLTTRVKGSSALTDFDEVLHHRAPGSPLIRWLVNTQDRPLPRVESRILARQLENAGRLIGQHGLLADLTPTIELSLVHPGQRVDREHRSEFRTAPHFRFYPQVAGEGHVFEEQLIAGLATIVHELVHFHFDLRRIEIPGDTPALRLLNEEIVAYAMEECARITFLRSAESGKPDVVLPFAPAFPAGMQLALLDRYGPSALGKVLAHRELSAARDAEILTDEDIASVTRRCRDMVEAPGNYWGPRGRQASTTTTTGPAPVRG